MKRDSSIELLRIIAMLMIVLHHLCLYGYELGNSSGSVDLVRNLLMLGGKIGVDVFVLISGFFLASGKIKTSSFLRVLLEAWFYSFAIGLACFAFLPGAFDAKTFLKSFLVTDGGLPWFVAAYLGMYLAAPWLAKLSSALEQKSFRQMVLVGFVVFSAIPTIADLKFVTSNFAWFCYLFLVACYIRRFGVDRVFYRRLLIGGGASLASR